MDPQRWRQISGILDQALELDGAAREALLAQACAGDDALRAEVESMLAADGDTPAWLARPAAISALTEADPLAHSRVQAGQRLGAFELVREIGHGGMGTVYLARRADGQFEQRAAIKVVRGDLDSERVMRAFRRERQILARLEHPHIARLIDGGLTPDGVPFFVMEHVDGEPITDHCARHKLPVEARLDLFLAVCAAVSAAHHAGVIHRDLKPSNVLVSTAGEVKLLDFGIAKLVGGDGGDLTRTATVAMTPLYAAPEQVRGEPVSEATDAHALGLLLFEMLTGKRARRPGRDAPDELMRLILEQEPERPSAAVARPHSDRPEGATTAPTATHATEALRRRLRGDLDNIVLKSLQKEPSRRYRSVEAMAEDVRRHLRGLPVTARPSSLAYRTSKLVRRRKAVLAAAAVALLAVAITVAAVLHARRVEEERPEAPLRFQLVSTTPGQHRSPTFAPDGRGVAYVDFTRGVPQLWVRDLAGGEPRQLTRGGGAVSRPRWSPRGDVILFARHGEGLWTVPAGAGEPRRIVEDGFSPSFSRDGTQIVFERRGGKIVIAAADGSRQRELPGVPASQWVFFTDMAPAFSPDGRWIAFFRCEHGPAGDLWVMSAAGGQARRLTHDLREGGQPVWAPDGRSIVFSSRRKGSRTLWRVPMAGGPPVPLTTGAGEDTDPAFDATGRYLLYTNAQNGYALTARDPSSGVERVIFESRSQINFPEFSPDGRRVAFFAATENGHQVFTVGADGSDLRRVTNGPGEFNYFPHWSGDSRSVYYFQYLPRLGLRRIAASGGESVEVSPEWGVFTNARVDPADRRVVYTVGEPWRPSATRVRDLASGAERALDTPLLGMRWTADGVRIVGYTLPREIVVCDAASGACHAIAGKAHSPAWAPGDRQVFFLRGPQRGDDPTLGSVAVWSVGDDGKGERHVADLSPIVVFGKSLAVSPRGELLWTRYQRGAHQIWMAELP